MVVYINGIAYDALRDYSITERVGNKTASTISVVVADQPFPQSGDIIELHNDNDEIIFYGMCGIPTSPKYRSLMDKRIYRITCGNANSILSNRIVNAAYQNHTITEIVQNLFDVYISAEGITLGAISDIPITMEVYTAADYNLQDAVNELADLVGATWTITTDRRFWFLAEDDFPHFPQVIDRNFLLGTDLQHKCKDYKTRTVQIVSGATDLTSEQSETYRYDGEQKSFTLVFPVAKKPSIFVNNMPVPSDRIGVKGMDDDNENIVFFFSFSSETISYVEGSEYLTVDDSVRFEYVGIFPIRVTAYNQSKITEIAQATGTSGLREQVEIDKSIATRADALQLAESLLNRFSEQTEEISFWLLSSELAAHGIELDSVRPLTVVEFRLPEIGIVGKYVITERTIEPHSADMHSDQKITLRLADRDYLKSYGETITDLRKGLRQLSIREDDIVIDTHNISDIEALSERYDYEDDFEHFAVQPASLDIFSPLDFGWPVYPTASAAKRTDIRGLYIPTNAARYVTADGYYLTIKEEDP